MEELKRIKREHISKYHPTAKDEAAVVAAEQTKKAEAKPDQGEKDTDAAIAERLKAAAEKAKASETEEDAETEVALAMAAEAVEEGALEAEAT